MATRWPASRLVTTWLAVVALSGCSVFLDAGGAGKASGEDRCGELVTTPGDQADQRRTLVIVADGSASGVSTGPGRPRRQDWAAVVEPMLPANDRTLVRWGVFGGDVEWFDAKLTAGASSNKYRDDHDRKAVRRCLGGELRTDLSTAPSRPGSDVLRALSEAGDELRGVTGPKRVIVATDGLVNTGCADLRKARIGDTTAIADMVETCAPEIPHLGADVEVRFAGLGRPAAGWPDVRPANRTWLVTLWTRLCEATGARCEPPTAKAPPQGAAATDAGLPADPKVEMRGITIKRTAARTVIYTSDSVLFDRDSWRLADRARDVLDELTEQIGGAEYRSIEVRGHTDAEGTRPYNRVLSAKRAKAVLAALHARGLRGLAAIGYGESRPRCVPQYRRGVPDARAMACNRRVEIVIHH